jgi:predicted transcriptional regulator
MILSSSSKKKQEEEVRRRMRRKYDDTMSGEELSQENICAKVLGLSAPAVVAFAAAGLDRV